MNHPTQTITLVQEISGVPSEIEFSVAACNECVVTVTRYQGQSNTQVFFRTDIYELRERLSLPYEV